MPGLARFLAPLAAFAVVALSLAPVAVAEPMTGKVVKPSPGLSYTDRPSEQTPLNLGEPDSAKPDKAEEQESSGLQVGRLILGLTLVISLIFAVRWVLQKINPKALKSVKQSEGIDVTASKALPGGGMLHVIQIGDRSILVGASASSITKIGELGEDEVAFIAAAESVSARRSLRGFRRQGRPSFTAQLAQKLDAPNQQLRQERTARRVETAGSGKLSWADRLREMTSR